VERHANNATSKRKRTLKAQNKEKEKVARNITKETSTSGASLKGEIPKLAKKNAKNKDQEERKEHLP
jgi:hypothetical protein